jgi:hypothetical protein
MLAACRRVGGLRAAASGVSSRCATPATDRAFHRASVRSRSSQPQDAFCQTWVAAPIPLSLAGVLAGLDRQ